MVLLNSSPLENQARKSTNHLQMEVAWWFFKWDWDEYGMGLGGVALSEGMHLTMLMTLTTSQSKGKPMWDLRCSKVTSPRGRGGGGKPLAKWVVAKSKSLF